MPSTNTLDIDRFDLPLSALLSNSTRQGSRNLTPVVRTVLFDHVHEGLVFLIGPGSLDHCRVQHFLPSMEALDISPVVEVASYPFPILSL